MKSILQKMCIRDSRTQQMIAVRVGENQVVDLRKVHARLFQLA